MAVPSLTRFFPFAVLGKAEGEGKLWHGHVTAVTVAPAYRRQGMAQKLMAMLEDVTISRWVRGGAKISSSPFRS